MDNIPFFEKSRLNPEPLFDPFYQKGVLVIPETIEQQNTLTQKNAELIELISAFDVLTKMGKDDSAEDIKNIVAKVIDILLTTENINYSAFSQFFMVYNSNYSHFKKGVRNKEQFIYEMLKRYCKERHPIYMSHGYSNSILQVMSDNYSHKRNSKSGINKLAHILESKGINRTRHYWTSTENSYILPDKGDRKLFETFLRKNRIEMKSRDTEQNKLPDCVFKVKDDYYIMELKSMKEGGGGQNKQIVEVANFIRFQESDPHIHYVTFLDGAYANLIFTDDSPKISTQRKDIIDLLSRNKQNYFVNTAGLTELCSALADN